MDASRILSAIFATGLDAVVVIDEAQEIVLFSAGAERIFGRSEDEVRGRPLDVLLPEAVREAHREHVRGFERSPVASRLMGERTILGRRRDGTLFPVEASISRLEVEGRRLYAAVLRDASARELAEAELRRSRQELALAQRLARIGSWEWEMAGDHVHWSEELHRIYGVPLSEHPITYERYLELVHPDDRDAVRDVVARALRDGAEFAFDHRIVRSDGQVRTLHARGHVLTDDDGKPVRMFGTGQDVTEREQAEERAMALVREQSAREAAESSASRFRFLAEAGQLLASSLDVEETLRSVARLAVPRLADWCAVDVMEPDGGVRRVEIAHADPDREQHGRAVSLRYPPEPSQSNVFWGVLLRGEPLLQTELSDDLLRQLARDEEHLQLLRGFRFRSAMAVPLVAGDRLLGAITLATAESGRRFGQDDLSLVLSLADRAALAFENARLFQEARAVARAREDAVATVSHDLRNPLSVVAMNAALLGEPTLPQATREEALRRIEKAAAGMRRMVRDLLDVTRLEAGGVRIRREALDVDAVVGEALELVQPAAEARGVRLERAVEPGLHVEADRDRVVQVLGNLLENAVRHAPEGSVVRTEARTNGDRVLLAVEDRGPGVAPELREQIFQRFWQSPRQSGRGAGLGLAIARGLVELHGGQIWVDHPAEGGARFCFTLGVKARRDS